MKREVKEAVGDLGHEELPEPPLAKLGQVEPEPEELEPEPEEFDAREYLTSGLDLGQYLEPLGFVPQQAVREGVVVYRLRHLPLVEPAVFFMRDDDDRIIRENATWANIHVRFDGSAALPFWRVLVTLGHEAAYFPPLRRVKVVRVDRATAESKEWIPDAVAATMEAMKIVQQPCRGHVIVLLGSFKRASFKPF